MKVEPGDMIAGQYRVIRRLGSGGMGSVYEVESKKLGNRLALKLLHHSNRNRDSERFAREAQLHAQLDHPNIVRALDIIEHDGQAGIVMELLQGMTLRQRIHNGPPMEVEDATRVALILADALAAAHDRGVTHRDLKPENVFLVHTVDGRPTPKLLDFGIARMTDSATLTETGSFIGTLSYASPEQLVDTKRVDFRSDIYSLGVILWEMLCGETPFGHCQSDAERIGAVLHGQLDALPASVPEGLRMLIIAMTSRDRDQRPKSAAVVRESLRPFTRSTSLPPNTLASDFLGANFRRSRDERERSGSTPGRGHGSQEDLKGSIDTAETLALGSADSAEAIEAAQQSQRTSTQPPPKRDYADTMPSASQTITPTQRTGPVVDRTSVLPIILGVVALAAIAALAAVALDEDAEPSGTVDPVETVENVDTAPGEGSSLALATDPGPDPDDAEQPPSPGGEPDDRNENNAGNSVKPTERNGSSYVSHAIPSGTITVATNVKSTRIIAGHTFDSQNLTDGDQRTAWMSPPLETLDENRRPSIFIAFAEPPVLASISVANGFQDEDQRFGDYFVAAARPRRLRVELGDGRTRFINMRPNQSGWTTVKYTPRNSSVSSLRITIEEVHAGELFQDIAISEFRFRAWNRIQPSAD